MFDPLRRVRVAVGSVREAWFAHPQLDVLVKSGKLGDEVRVLDLGDRQRALVWIDGRFDRIVGPGLHALWTLWWCRFADPLRKDATAPEGWEG